MGVTERGGVLSGCDEPCKVGHVDQEKRADLVANHSESRKIEMARISRAAGNDQLRPVLLRQSFDLVEVDQMIVLAHSILDSVEPFAGLGRRSPVSQVAARCQAEAHDRVAGLQQREHHSTIGLSPRVWLDIRKLAAEQLLRAFDCQGLDRIGGRAALIIAAAGITFRIFVGQHRPLCLEHRAAHDVF